MNSHNSDVMYILHRVIQSGDRASTFIQNLEKAAEHLFKFCEKWKIHLKHKLFYSLSMVAKSEYQIEILYLGVIIFKQCRLSGHEAGQKTQL